MWLIPPPPNLSAQAWHLFALFIALILGVLFRPFPLGATALTAMTAAIVTKTLDLGDALKGFSSEVVWLILSAMFIARGFITTGLGKRVSFKILSIFGGNSLGIGYGLILTDLILAPTIPSVTARVGGIIYPVLRSIVSLFKKNFQDPNMSAFLTQVVFQGSVVTSAMFLTSIAGNPLIASLSEANGIPLSWSTWMVAAIVPGLCSLVIVPVLIFRLFSPQTRKTPFAKEIARKSSIELGKMKKDEWIVCGTFLFLISLWIFGPRLGIGVTESALVGLIILIVTNVLDWQELLALKNAWDIFIWFSVLIAFSSSLNSLGFTDFLRMEITTHIRGMNWVLGFGILGLLYFYLHYLFISAIAQITAFYSSFVMLAIALGTPPLFAALSFAFLSNLMACLTHYGSGQAPILFEMGTVTTAKWWKTGLLVSFVNLVIWLGLGSLWWKLIGVY